MAKTADEKGRKVPPPSAGGTHLHRGNAEVHDIEATPPNHPFANHIAPAGRLESHYSAHQEPPTSRRTWMIRPRPTYIERLSANRWFVQSRAQGFVPTRARLDKSNRHISPYIERHIGRHIGGYGRSRRFRHCPVDEPNNALDRRFLIGCEIAALTWVRDRRAHLCTAPSGSLYPVAASQNLNLPGAPRQHSS